MYVIFHSSYERYQNDKNKSSILGFTELGKNYSKDPCISLKADQS